MRGWLIVVLFLGIGFVSPAFSAMVLPSVDATIFDFEDDGVGNFINSTGGVQALNSSGFDSRGIIEFNLAGLNQSISGVFLRVYRNAAQGPFPLTIDVYGYSGDGALAMADYADGLFWGSFDYSDDSFVDVDLGTHVNDAIALNDSFLGINLRMHDQSGVVNGPPFVSFKSLELNNPAELSFSVGSTSSSAIPEPASLVLVAGGLLGVWKRRQYSRQGHRE